VTPRVRAEVVAAVAVAAVAVLGAASFLHAIAAREAALRWAAVAALVLLGEFAYLAANLDVHRADGGSRRRSLGVANAVTLCRGGLYAAAAGFVTVAPADAVAWFPALCYGAGAALDWVDGRVARVMGAASRLGAKLDLAFDTLGFVVAPLVAVAWGRLPVWYLALSAARFAFKGGVAWRRRGGKPVYDLPESRVRRPLAGFQMAFLSVALAPVLPASLVVAVAPLALAPSLVVFGRDYLVVSGRLESGVVS
jgi:CDP-diacylglycerol--glycerol-3-phosphate 3-phosphatidyltransferase